MAARCLCKPNTQEFETGTPRAPLRTSGSSGKHSMPQSQFDAALFSGPLQADQNRRCQCLPPLNVLRDSMKGRGERRSSASQRATSRRWLDVNPSRASRRRAAPRIPAITCADTPNSCAISRAEWGRSQPSPKYKRMTFSCCGLSFRSRKEMPGRSIRSGCFGT